MFEFLPNWLREKLLSTYTFEYIFEIRIRENKPIVVNYKGKYQQLCDREDYKMLPVIASSDLIKYILSVSTRQSIYAFNEQIKNCYIGTSDGVRIGICGTAVYSNGEVVTIKNITSLCIRIAHEVPNCSEPIINLICRDGYVKNTLIISPPGAGKTTMIRDLVSKLSSVKNINNILVVDERNEISMNGLNSCFDIGDYVDVISNSKKSFAFNECLKSMCPNVIVTDEIAKEEDIESIKTAIKSGVSVIASAHAKNIDDLKFKPYFKTMLELKYFERIIVLSKRNGVGTIECVYDENLRGIYLPYML